MKYITTKQKQGYITLEDFIQIVEESLVPEVRRKTLLKKDGRTFRLVLDCKDYSYKLLKLEDFNLLSEKSFDDGFNKTIEVLLTDGYEIIYED